MFIYTGSEQLEKSYSDFQNHKILKNNFSKIRVKPLKRELHSTVMRN